MKSLWYFFRLIRPLNLLVIVLTMGVFQVFLSKYQKHEKPGGYFDYSVFDPEGFLKEPSIWDSSIFQTNFLLLVFSTVLIAAAGNIINDYFDVKADRVNKPDLLIIDKYIKRRWAIVFNWIFNSVGLLIAMYLGWKLQNWFIALTPFVCINLLWFYSAFFKRKFLIGNLLVAFLTALVPIYVLMFYFPLHPFGIAVNMQHYEFHPEFIVNPVMMIALVAFLINLVREIIKDIADVKGDLLLHAKTIPIQWGIRRAKWVLFILLLPLLVSFFAYILYCWELDFVLNGGSMGFPGHNPPLINSTTHLYFGICALLILILVGASYIMLAFFDKRKHYIISSNLLKLAMFFGLLTPLFL